ncbi:hypothetical protein N802_05170 [Knoellia sinensis KCTC 19936]|uniref:Uncharacterized protein n=1 Tax=Knoellia sinensis KCTC 19936 TaxID=1385520 RepID=A0A0A0J611_9MICO|nr:hypothetical protein [Knoellia sinensis]KGN30996.1 hypothetical protein N802_05170 [Knoellia sinensis KCTC 19936]
MAAPAVITLAIWAVSQTAPDWGLRPEMFILWAMTAAMSFVPAVMGAAIGYAVRSPQRVAN